MAGFSVSHHFETDDPPVETLKRALQLGSSLAKGGWKVTAQSAGGVTFERKYLPALAPMWRKETMMLVLNFEPLATGTLVTVAGQVTRPTRDLLARSGWLTGD